MEKLFYSWDEQLKDTNEICELIEKDDFVPDVIVGISRGGLIPGVMISHKSVSYTHLTLPTTEYV